MSRAFGGTFARGVRAVAALCLASAALGATAVSAEAASESAGARRGSAASAPDTCATGYVWRGARASDHVCVTPVIRDRTARENLTGVLGVRGYYLTPGAQVTVRIVHSATGRVLWSGRATARAGGKGPGGNYALDTGHLLCQGSSFTPPLVAYAQARENAGAWSPRVPIAWRECSRL